MGRARKRARRAAQASGPAAPPRQAVPSAPPDPRAERESRLQDPEWRRAERRRIARLSRLPGPFRTWGDRSRWHGAAVTFLQLWLVVLATLLLMRALTGTWLPRYAAVVALALAVATQFACRAVNTRADARAEGSS